MDDTPSRGIVDRLYIHETTRGEFPGERGMSSAERTLRGYRMEFVHLPTCKPGNYVSVARRWSRLKLLYENRE